MKTVDMLPPPSLIIEMLNDVCNIVDVNIPKIIAANFKKWFLLKVRAIKLPINAEARVCNRLAPTKRMVPVNKLDIPSGEFIMNKKFSAAAKPRAAVIK